MENHVYKLYAIIYSPYLKEISGKRIVSQGGHAFLPAYWNANRGRIVSQGGHAFLHAYWNAVKNFPEDAANYQNQDAAFKITLVTDDEALLRNMFEKYKHICGVSLVEERGIRGDGTINEKVKGITCLGLGPIRTDLIEDDLKSLKSFI